MENSLGQDPLKIGKETFTSRVFVGTAAYPNRGVLMESLAAANTELVTVSLRRVSPIQKNNDAHYSLYKQLKDEGYKILPNTAGCFSVKEAVTTAQMARESLETNLIKLEVIADEETLLPEPFQLLEAAKQLVALGFEVYPYMNNDVVLAKRLEEVGCVAVMPLGSPIGTGLGILNPHALKMIKENVKVPVIVDAGLGTASDVSQTFELGLDGVLLNTAIARAKNPQQMALAIKYAAMSGRQAFLSGRMPKKTIAQSASPLEGKSWLG